MWVSRIAPGVPGKGVAVLRIAKGRWVHRMIKQAGTRAAHAEKELA
ncbi:MAG: hypothetical protein K0R28_4569, partial [Paenibacillus sp.]|nr:hypothetical protein [Paenibacillus sp.]